MRNRTPAAMARCQYVVLGLLWLLSMGGCQTVLPPYPRLQTVVPADPFAGDGLSFRVLCYHDVRDGLRGTLREWPEATAVDSYDLIQQFSWLRDHGYHVVSLDAILAARHNGPPLPSKAILLTFDDGYRSMYTRVFPLLKLFHYPAVLALVGEWLEDHADGKVFYGDRWLPREQFVTWAQVREMQNSGLVEIASHSHHLHKGLVTNAQGSMPPAAIARAYDAATRSYEDDTAYFTRIYTDLVQNSTVIERHTGIKPRVMVWPYGAYTMPAVAAAHAAGMPITMTLEPGANTPAQPLARIRRRLVYFHYSVGDLQQALREPAELDGEDRPLQRIVQVNLETIYDADPVQQENNLSRLIERLHRMRVNTVYLQAAYDADGNGMADALYFPNRHLPMRADVLNRVAWQLRGRANVNVYAWLPVWDFEFAEATPAPTAQRIQEIYEDLAKNTPLAGLVLHDTRAHHDIPEPFPLELVARFRVYQPAILTVRTLAALPGAEPHGPARLAQAIGTILQGYDFAAVLAENTAPEAQRRLRSLVGQLAPQDDILARTVFLLPGIMPDVPQASASARLAGYLQELQQSGARNFGYTADDFKHNNPLFEVVKPVMSLATNPGRQP